MKTIIVTIITATAVAVAAWAFVGLCGVADGAHDECTRSFVWACAKLGIGGAS